MSPVTPRFVVDASVGIKLFLAEPLSDRADALFDLLTADPPAELVVPDLFYIECADILWKQVRRAGYPPERARHDLDDLAVLSLQVVPSGQLMRAAQDIAIAHGITTYDACYLALAQRTKMPRSRPTTHWCGNSASRRTRSFGWATRRGSSG